MTEKNYEKSRPRWQALVDARKVLGPVLEQAGLWGRCWGRKPTNGERNPQQGSHITIGNEDCVVTVFQDPTTHELVVQEFARTEGTFLGNEVRSRLKDEGLL